MSRISTRALVACLVASLSGCSYGPAANQTTLPSAQARRPASSTASQENVYILNDPYHGPEYVSVYANGTSRVLYRIKNGAASAVAMLLDPTGNVYLWNYLEAYNPLTSVIVIAANTNKRLYTIDGGQNPQGRPAIDRQGNLYVPLIKKPQIFVYTAGTRKLSRKIHTAVPFYAPMVFDSQNNLYILTSDSTVVEYAAGTDRQIRTVNVGKNSFEMVFDASDNLYVLGFPQSSQKCAIEVFPPNATVPSLTIAEGLSKSHAMAFDSGGDLFVLNANDITAYHPGTTSPYLTFNRNNAGESYMAIDSSNNLYVTAATGGHFNLGYFKVFDLGSGKLLRTVSRDVNGPFGFAIGP
jgi:hypothetical protein